MNPSCFGLPSVINTRAKACRECPVREQCLASCRTLARKLFGAPKPGTEAHPQFGLTRTPVERNALTDAHKQTIAALPKKVSPRYEGMVKKGMDQSIRESLAKGVNPFAASGASYLRIACDMLLKGQVEKGALKDALMEKLGWSDGTAASHVSVVVALFPAIGAAKVEGRCLMLSPTLRKQN